MSFAASARFRSSDRSNDPSSATRPARRVDCNQSAMAGFAAAHRLGVAAEPVRETRRTETWIVAWHEALVVHCYAVIERLGIGDYRPCVPGCVQELPHEVVLTDRFGTGQIDRAVQWLREGGFGHDGGDIIRHNGLHQNRWKPNRLPFSRRLGDAAHELEELRRAD